MWGRSYGKEQYRKMSELQSKECKCKNVNIKMDGEENQRNRGQDAFHAINY